MTWVDAVVLAVLALSALLAFSRGLVREVLSLGAWVGAIFAAVWALPRVRPQVHQWIGESPWVDPVAFALVFIVSLIVLSIVARCSAIWSVARPSAALTVRWVCYSAWCGVWRWSSWPISSLEWWCRWIDGRSPCFRHGPSR